MKVLVVLLSLAAVAVTSPVAQDDSVLRMVIGNFVNCVNSEELNICLKEHALKASERLGSVRKLKLSEGVTLIHEGEREAKSLEPLSEDPDVKSRQLTDRLWDSASDLLKNSDLELSYSDDDDDDKESRALGDVEEGRGKKKKIKKKLKALIPLAILAKVKAIFLGLLAIWIIAISVFKIAAIAKIAFIAKIIALLKLLLAKKHHTHTEEVWIPPPHHEEHVHGGGHGWEGGWSRSRPEANNLAYSAYRK